MSVFPNAKAADEGFFTSPLAETDPEIADDIKTYMVALIELPARAHAAE